MTLIILVTIILFLVLIGWTWSNLEKVERNKKIGYTVISIVIMFIITWIIFSISKSGVNYENSEMVGPVRILLVSIFTAINGFVVIQYIAKILGKINDDSIEEDEAKKKFIKIIFIFIIVAIIECSYMKSIQQGILSVFNNLK